MNYAEKLKDPRWQKKRLKIFERDNWKCVLCGDDKATLHVHHTFYKKNCNPWDYQDKNLMTLCENCHSYEHKDAFNDLKNLLEYFKEIGLTITDIFRFLDDTTIFSFRERNDLHAFEDYILHLQYKQYCEGLKFAPDDYYKIYSGKELNIHEKKDKSLKRL